MEIFKIIILFLQLYLLSAKLHYDYYGLVDASYFSEGFDQDRNCPKKSSNKIDSIQKKTPHQCTTLQFKKLTTQTDECKTLLEDTHSKIFGDRAGGYFKRFVFCSDRGDITCCLQKYICNIKKKKGKKAKEKRNKNCKKANEKTGKIWDKYIKCRSKGRCWKKGGKGKCLKRRCERTQDYVDYNIEQNVYQENGLQKKQKETKQSAVINLFIGDN